VPAKDRNAWTLGGIAIDQVSYKEYLGVVYQEDGSWHTRKGACKDASSLWVLGHCCHAAVCRQRSDCSWFRPSSIPRSCMARKCETTKAVKDKMSAVVKALRSILACIRDCSSDVLYGDTGLLPPGVLIDAAKL
jgi:hypothetical protein